MIVASGIPTLNRIINYIYRGSTITLKIYGGFIMSENLNTSEQNLNDTATEEVTFSEAQKEAIAKMIQAESDRRTNQALAKQKKEYEKKINLASLDGAEREKQEQLNTIAELREQLAQYQIEKNRSEVKSVLSSRGLSAEFADFLKIGEDVEENQSVIDGVDKLFKAAVKSEVEKRLAAAGTSPKGNGSGVSATVTKDSAKSMSLAELQQLKKTHPELYANLYN